MADDKPCGLCRGTGTIFASKPLDTPAIPWASNITPMYCPDCLKKKGK